MNIFNHNGKLYLRKGGKLHYIPKAQLGQSLSQSLTGLSQQLNDYVKNPSANSAIQDKPESWFNKTIKDSPSVITGVGSLIGTGLNSFVDRNPKNGPSGEYGSRAMDAYQGRGIEKFGSSAVNAAAMLDPTGTSALVKAGLDIGRGIGNLAANRDEYGVSKTGTNEVVSNMFDPLGRMQQSFNIGKKHGFKEGLKDFVTFGVSGNKLMGQTRDRAVKRDEEKDMLMRQGLNKGNFNNSGIYAKYGAYLQKGGRFKPNNNPKEEPNVEIEDGEIYLGDPRMVKVHGDADTSLNSSHGAKFHGDKHGEDTDGDGMEGIPLTSGQGYVASDYLGLDGKKASKSNPSVAKVMTPYMDQLAKIEENTSDRYMNNPLMIAHNKNMINSIKAKAEKNKFLEELSKQLKSKDRDFSQIMQYIATEAPVEDMTPAEQQVLEQAKQKILADEQSQTMLEEEQVKANPDEMGNVMQEGGQVNPSSEYMNQLNTKSKTMQPMQGPQGQNQMSMSRDSMSNKQMNPNAEMMDPKVQEMFEQLPPQLQEEIMKLPPDQQEIAIISAYEDMQEGEEPEMEAPETEDESAEAEAAVMEQMREGGLMHYPRELNSNLQPHTTMPGQYAQDSGRSNTLIYKKGGYTKTCRVGDYVRFKVGGSIVSGRIKSVDSKGNFELE